MRCLCPLNRRLPFLKLCRVLTDSEHTVTFNLQADAIRKNSNKAFFPVVQGGRHGQPYLAGIEMMEISYFGWAIVRFVANFYRVFVFILQLKSRHEIEIQPR